MPDEDDDVTRRDVASPTAAGAEVRDVVDESDALLSALLDGELDASTEASVRERIVREPALAERLASFERLGAALRELPAAQLPSDLADRMRARLAEREREDAPLERAPSRSPRRSAPPRRRRLWPAVAGLSSAAAAAAVALYLLSPAATPERPVARETTPDHDAEPSALAQAQRDELGIALYYDELADLELLEQLELLEVLVALEEAEQG
jgi:anti-sigma factor RsiW